MSDTQRSRKGKLGETSRKILEDKNPHNLKLRSGSAGQHIWFVIKY